MSTTFALFGLAVNGLIAVGRAHLVSHATLEVRHYTLSQADVGGEQNRLIEAQAELSSELTRTWRQAQKDQPPDIAAMIEVQQLILHDPQLVSYALTRIATEFCNAEWALVQSMAHLVAQFRNMDNAYLAERQHDIRQITERLLQHMHGKPDALATLMSAAHQAEPMILVAHDLSPAELITIGSTFQEPMGGWSGFITEMGGENAHTSILARAQEMPAIVAVPMVCQLIQEFEWVVIDGTLGAIIVNPDAFTLAQYHSKVDHLNAKKSYLQRIAQVPTQTLDSVRVKLMANVSAPEEVRLALKYGAEGIGLFRSEFLFMRQAELPDEACQLDTYRQVLQLMSDKPVTIRTLDIGGDKLLHVPAMQALLHNQAEAARNSQLGMRAIRLSLAYPDIFRVQLRALLRASVYGNLHILLPMVTAEFEVSDTIALIEECQAELRHEGKAFRAEIPLGIMIEVPAVLAIIPHVADKLRFLSLGTNDLIQYALAVDRGSVSVGYLYNPVHPGIMQLMHQAIQAAKSAALPLSLCGELGGDPHWTKMLLGLGLRELSMTASQLLAVKQTILISEHAVIARKIKRWRSLRQDSLELLFRQLNAQTLT